MFAEWVNSPAAFVAWVLADLGDRPTDLHSLDRKDNDGDYTPGNLRWATKKEQTRNTRYNVWFTIDGVRKLAIDWADERGLPRNLVTGRIRRKMSAEKILMPEKKRRA